MASAPALITLGGLPLHPLVVHAVVVLLPLSALGAAAAAIRPAWRRRYQGPLALLTVLSVAAVPLATSSGEQLRDALKKVGGNDPQLAAHTALGEGLLPYALAFGVSVLVLLAAGRLADSERAAAASAAADRRPHNRSKLWRRIALAAAVLVLATATATTVDVVRIGHSGAAAAWQGVGS